MVSGALCHVFGPLEPTSATRDFAEIYVVDPDEQLATRQGMDAARGLNNNWIAFLQNSILLPVNPFATLYKLAREILAAANTAMTKVDESTAVNAQIVLKAASGARSTFPTTVSTRL